MLETICVVVLFAAVGVGHYLSVKWDREIEHAERGLDALRARYEEFARRHRS